MITKRVEKDRLVVVIGIAQSRRESLDAVRRFDKAGLLTLGIGVTGSRMVDGLYLDRRGAGEGPSRSDRGDQPR